MKKNIKSFVAKTIIATAIATSIFVPSTSQAQWAVIDIASIIQTILSELNQLEQIEHEAATDITTLKHYEMEFENLKQLSGPARIQALNNLVVQLKINLNDFGASDLNGSMLVDTTSGDYYSVTDGLLKLKIGSTTRVNSLTNADLAAVGLPDDGTSGIGANAAADRAHYERVLDDYRLAAQTRQNAQTRSVQATLIANNMQSLGDNNVGASLQVISAQNTLTYAQMEDLLKLEAAILKGQQESQTRTLVSNEARRKRELDRLHTELSTVPDTAIDMQQ